MFFLCFRSHDPIEHPITPAARPLFEADGMVKNKYGENGRRKKTARRLRRAAMPLIDF